MGLSANAARGQGSATLFPSKDNTIYEDAAGALSNGAGEYLFAGNSGLAQHRRALLAFDIAGELPAGAVIDSVRLALTMSRTVSDAQTVALHRITSDWGEGASAAAGNEGGGGPATEGDATWSHAFFDTIDWNTEGGDFSEDTSAVFTFDAVAAYTVLSTENLVRDVQDWLDRPEENFGWILIGNEQAGSTAKRFNSREHADPATRPSLTIYYTTSTAADNPAIALPFRVRPAYPNPFRTHTSIPFDLSIPALVHIEAYDLLGRRVWESPARAFAAGAGHLIDIDGSRLSPGVYIYRLSVTAHGITRTAVGRIARAVR